MNGVHVSAPENRKRSNPRRLNVNRQSNKRPKTSPRQDSPCYLEGKPLAPSQLPPAEDPVSGAGLAARLQSATLTVNDNGRRSPIGHTTDQIAALHSWWIGIWEGKRWGVEVCARPARFINVGSNIRGRLAAVSKACFAERSGARAATD